MENRRSLLVLWPLILAACLTAISGCGRTLRVHDENGIPIAGAEVVVTTMSATVPQGLTSDTGRCRVDNWFPGAEWFIHVSKPGFIGVSVEFPRKWPATVMLPRQAATSSMPDQENRANRSSLSDESSP